MNRRGRGFTLIEVLIAVLILAIGLLALGAVIPVVVRQQRNAADSVIGVDVVRGAVDFLKSRGDLNRLTLPNTNTPAGWGVWLQDAQWSPSTGTPKNRHLWVLLGTDELDPQDGDYSFDPPGNPSEDSEITVAERLWPTPTSDGVRPQFVWDFIGRRLEKPTGDTSERLQLAIFVRRIDINIRTTSAYSLVDVLTDKMGQGGVPNNAKRKPVATSVLNGMPTLNGIGPYARVVQLGAKLHATQRDILELLAPTGGTNPSNPAPAQPGNPIKLAMQVGQKLVDNFGNVYTVTEVEPLGEKDKVRVSPVVPAWVPDEAGTNVTNDCKLRQVVFTPQIPAAVEIVTLNVGNP